MTLFPSGIGAWEITALAGCGGGGHFGTALTKRPKKLKGYVLLRLSVAEMSIALFNVFGMQIVQ